MRISLGSYKFAITTTQQLFGRFGSFLSGYRFPILIMTKKLIPIILPALAFLTLTTPASAQTCRVNVGSSATGCVNYLEVYEYDFVTDKPTFPGGDHNLLSYINKERKYPKKAYMRGVQGRVTCSFVVNADGSISHVSVLRGVEQSLNREAVRILSEMPSWTPGRLDGRPVPTRVVWSIPFRK